MIAAVEKACCVETPLFFEHKGSRLFAMLYEPPNDTALGGRCGMVFCAPFAEEATISQKVCVDFLRHLAERGFVTLRFDYRGFGDSEGSFRDLTPSTMVEDIHGAMAHLRRHRVERIGLCGLRFGATLAAIVAGAQPEVDFLLLWEPVVDMQGYLKNFLRAQVIATNSLAGRPVETRANLITKLNRGEPVDILGYPLSPSCAEEIEEIDVLTRAEGYHGPALVASIGRSKRRRQELKGLIKLYENQTHPFKLMEVEGTPFWVDPNNPWQEMDFLQGHETLFVYTADWLETVLSHS